MGQIGAHNREAYVKRRIPLNRAELADLGMTARERGVGIEPYGWLQ